jgi:transcriptional regulator with XRE-family HTH domain
MDIANRLRNARELTGKSQTQVSKDTGINNKTLSGYERGVSEPDLKTLKLLSDYYGVSLNYLLGNSGTEDPYKEEVHELSDDDIITLAAHSIGHLNDLSEEDKEKVRLAIKIALMKDKSSKGD